MYVLKEAPQCPSTLRFADSCKVELFLAYSKTKTDKFNQYLHVDAKVHSISFKIDGHRVKVAEFFEEDLRIARSEGITWFASSTHIYFKFPYGSETDYHGLYNLQSWRLQSTYLKKLNGTRAYLSVDEEGNVLLLCGENLMKIDFLEHSSKLQMHAPNLRGSQGH